MAKKNKKKIFTFDRKDKINETIAYLRNKTPFHWEKKEVIYLGGLEDSPVTSFIQENFLRIEKLFAQKGGYKFTYIPHLINPELIRYNYPFLKEEQIQQLKPDTQVIESAITSYIGTPLTYPCFIRWGKDPFVDDRLYVFSPTTDILFEEQLNAYFSHLQEWTDGPVTRFSSINFSWPYERDEEENKEYADNEFETQRLLQEIREKIFRLRQMGVSEYILKEILLQQPQPLLSRLVITSDYKIILPDYNHTEIRLHPLPKTVYLFFLKHPEGIRFKHLIDHRAELISIYKRLTNKESLEEIYRSIDTLTDSTKNSINEKCSRIKEAFYDAITPALADHYLITGKSSTPKSIALDRDLVIWETVF